MNHNTILSIIMLSLLPVLSQGRELALRTVGIEAGGRVMKMKVLHPKEADGPVPGILWIHGGGYITGGNYMVLVSCGKMLAERYGAVVVSPEYRLAGEAPYPAALEDCYAALVWMYEHADELGIARVGDSRRRYASTPGTRGRSPSPFSCRSIRCWTARTRHHRPITPD